MSMRELLGVCRKKIIALSVLTLFPVLSCTTPLTPDITSNMPWVCVWSDECDGAADTPPDADKWGYEIGYKRNDELQYYTSRNENVRYNGLGQLVIETRRENYQGYAYTSASVTTKGKYSFQYGKIVIQAKLPFGKGIWPALWMLGKDGTWPSNGEIDIMEMVGGGDGFDNVIHMTAHYSRWYNWHEKDMTPFKLAAGNFSDAYHTFELEWNATRLIWRVDGVTLKTLATTVDDMSEFRQPFYIKIGTAIGGSWPNNVNKRPDASTPLPQYLFIDSVRVYQR